MCTATYLPLGKGGFLLSSSRDEKLSRPAACLPATETIGYQSVIFPKDPRGQGSWIALSEGRAVCLLNGAFENHQPKPPYQHSRGLVVLAVFGYDSFDEFVQDYDFSNLEPFTLLMAETNRLLELRWDGERVYTTEKDPQQPHIWSSATLYSAPVRQVRAGWFADWLSDLDQTSDRLNAIRQFHKTAGADDPTNAICMNRAGVYGTVSLTSVVCEPGQTEMIYEDFNTRTITHLLLADSYATT